MTAAPARFTPPHRPAFTMIEIVIVLVLMSVVAAMAIPKLNLSQFRADAAAQQVRSVFQTAQRTSLTRQYDVIVSVDTLQFGLRIAEDSSNDGSIQVGEWKFWRPTGEGNRFATPPISITGGTVSTPVVGSQLRTVDGMPSTFTKGKKERQKPIALPSTAILANLSTIATSSGWNFATNGGTASNAEASVRDRIEFVAFDLTPTLTNGDSTDFNEGFFRIYNGRVGADTVVRGDWPGVATTPPAIANVNFCGDFHWMSATQQGFYPASQHNKSWFKAQVKAGYLARGYSAATATTFANADSVSTLHKILANAPAHGEDPARCYLAGDPHLVWIDRGAGAVNPLTAAAYTAVEREKGGTDTTFTPNGAFGSWRLHSATPNDSVRKYRPTDAGYLFPIDRSFNPNAKGVIYTSGNVGISGIVNGRITLYAKGTIVLLDDIRYANDPVKGVCRDILGIISDKDVVIADNALNDPPVVSTVSSSPFYFSLDDSKDFYVHGVMMALGNSFRVQNYSSGPNNVNDCNGTNNGRGCIYLSGGVIQNIRGAVGLVSGEGYQKRYSYDRCAVVNPPPYFPTTGRFQDNRYLELDPAGFNHTRYFRSLTPDP